VLDIAGSASAVSVIRITLPRTSANSPAATRTSDARSCAGCSGTTTQLTSYIATLRYMVHLAKVGEPQVHDSCVGV